MTGGSLTDFEKYVESGFWVKMAEDNCWKTFHSHVIYSESWKLIIKLVKENV